MIIHICDSCKKEMPEKTLGLGVGNRFTSAELCYECAVPLFKYLKKIKPLHDEIIKLEDNLPNKDIVKYKLDI